jgi:hypothetical protein
VSGDLIEFLRARLDDDCAVIADPSVPGNESCQLSNGPRREYWSKERALAEVDVKLRIIAAHGRAHECISLSGAGDHSVFDGQPWELWELSHTEDHGPCHVLRLLALPYAGHPDYRPEWAPQ